MPYVFPPSCVASVPVRGTAQCFPVHRIYCVGRNYAQHAQEMGATGQEPPFFFMKPADAIVPIPEASVGAVPYPSLTQDFHHEIELVIAIGQGGAIYGYAVGLDMTRRDLQAQMKAQGRPWCIAKGFDASAPIGPIVTGVDVSHSPIALFVNGELRQSGRIDQMLCNAEQIVQDLSRAWTLQAGDLIFSGTPAGVGAVQRGDVLRGCIEGLPDLCVRVV